MSSFAYYGHSSGPSIPGDAPVPNPVPAGADLQLYVRSSEKLFGYLFSPNSEGKPFLNSEVIEIKSNVKTAILNKDGTSKYKMPQWSVKYGILVSKSEKDLKRHLTMIRDWSQFDNLLDIRIKDEK